ncbi:hypothetical protein [Fibrivirga algicola]|uniref:Outer membrane protein beta-barrel domain-containing protein n=1 Tax=Fibrivirga algicola TaxID=2950420 RepID=A0ABX0QL05_9BACT|nr:hypothetical protein [Fibrivirga algicola]NID13150.1 hypothetical protein [Fibrivirga algicola]
MLTYYSTINQPSFSRIARLVTISLFLTLITCKAQAQQPPPAHEYPRVVLYQGILHPIVTFSQEAPVVNFKSFYQVGFPVGVNIWKTAKIGYSLEVVPFIRSEAGISRVNNVLFHPGVLVGLGNGFTLANRLAFETAGRYGVTPVFNKTFRRPGPTKRGPVNYFLAIPLPVRFGNDRPTSVTVGFQFGVAF